MNGSSSSEDTGLDQTACVNCALALCILAEKHNADKAVSILQRAIKLYEIAISRDKHNIKVI